MIHDTIKPSGRFRELFCCYHFICRESEDEHVFPFKAGPKTALAICYAGSYCQEKNGKREDFPKVAVIGPVLRPCSVVFSRGDFGLIVAEFTETGYYTLFGEIPERLVNSFVDFSKIAGDDTAEKARDLAQKLNAGCSEGQMAVLLEDLLETLGMGRDSGPAQTVRDAAEIIKKSVHDIDMSSLAGMLGVTARTLQRRFKTVTGLTPKQYAEITRFTKLFDYLLSDDRVGLVKKLYSLGYYDQAHAIREFKKYAGCSPRKIMPDYHGIAAGLSRRFAENIHEPD